MPYDRKAYYQRTREKQIAAAVEWAKNNPERHRALTTASEKGRRFRDPIGFLLGRTKWRAKQDGRDFDLERSDIIIPEVCPVLGIELFFNEVNVKHEKNPNSPSIDRIDSSAGYTKGNILVCSWRANQLKSNGTLDEFKKLVEFMTQQAGIV